MNHGNLDGAELSRRRALGLLGFPLLLGACAVRTVAPPGPATERPALPAADLGAYPIFPTEPGLVGRISCEGSSAVGLILDSLRDDFRKAQPEIELEVISAGSGTATRALAEARCDLAPMSRAMTDAERERVEKARGVPVRWIDLAVDAIAICVNADNPLERISLRDLDRILGRERKRGGAPAATWADLGVEGEFGTRTIVAVGMGPDTGSNGLVRETVLLGGPFRTTVLEEPVSSAVMQAIAADPAAIGYCSFFFAERPRSAGAKARPARTRTLALETLDGTAFVRPDDESIRAGRYPLARSLRIYFVDDPRRPNPAARQLLRFLVSEDGQTILAQLGQKTLSPEQAQEMFRRIG